MRKLPLIILTIALILSKPNISWALEVQDPNRSLRTQIMLQNLTIGLFLSDAQMISIIGEARRVKALEEDLSRDIKANLASQTNDLLALKEETKKDVPEISPGLARQIHQKKVLGLRMNKEYREALETATNKVKGLLNDSQIYTMTTFKPCLVPPKGPSRVGQDSSDDGPGTRLLERVRKIPDRRYQTVKNDLVNRFLEKASLMHPRQVNDKTIATFKGKLLDIIEEVRGLSDIEFELSKGKKGEAILSLIRPQKREVSVERRIAKFLLSPEIIPVLKEQLAENN